MLERCFIRIGVKLFSQALGKARGDGLGMEFSRAEFTIKQSGEDWRATVEIDGVKKPRYIHLGIIVSHKNRLWC